MARGVWASGTSNTSSRFEAGSVLTSSTRLPAAARLTATAHETEVLPTPPLPVKNRLRVGRCSNCMLEARLSAAAALAGCAGGTARRGGGFRRDSQLLAQLAAARVTALGDDAPVGDHHRQAC